MVKRDKAYRLAIMDEYGLTRSSCYGLIIRWNMKTFQEVYTEIVYRERIKEKLKGIMSHTSPSVLAPMFNTKHPNASAISFVNNLYFSTSRSIVFNRTKKLIEKALEIVDVKVEVYR